ncbi:MAG: hypothetical protein LH603_02585 [Pseudonocardia sp.]|nr:hypothetical protein [Pseudonocardia sp.]
MRALPKAATPSALVAAVTVRVAKAATDLLEEHMIISRRVGLAIAAIGLDE